MGREDTRAYFAHAIEELRQRRQFVDFDDSVTMELFHAIHQQDPCNTQGPCPSKPFEGLEQCLPWHRRARALVSRGYLWLRAMISQKACPEEDLTVSSVEYDEMERLHELPSRIPIIPRDRAQANPVWGWNNANHGIVECGTTQHVLIRG